MKNSRRIINGLMALTMITGIAGMTACSKDGDDTSSNNTTTQAATTTTAATVAINTDTLKAEEAEVLSSITDALPDVELENKTIKWLAHYDQNPDSTGKSKSVALEMFETKYGGKIEWMPTTWENRYNDLSTMVLGGEGVDFFPGDDTFNFPKGIINGMFQPVDDYVDMSSSIWQNVKEGYEIYNFGGKHYEFVTDVTAQQVCFYNKNTIEAYGFDDPYELYKEGKWNWDIFKTMLLDFVDQDAGRYGLDGWYTEMALFTSTGVPLVGTRDGNVVTNVNDATVEKALNFGYDLYNNGLMYPFGEFGWSTHLEFIGSGDELFYLGGIWNVGSAPETWEMAIDPEDLGIAPVPSPAGSDPYQSATVAGYALCKGAQNPEGVSLFAQCNILATLDENAIAISDRKAKDDYKWTDEIIAINKEINELAKKYPVVDLSNGCSNDIVSLTTGDHGMRAPFRGTEWAVERETIADTLILLVDEVDQSVKKKQAE